MKGVVSKVSNKQWQNKTFWSFQLSGDRTFYSTGTNAPPGEGVYIEFDDVVNGKGYHDAKNVTIAAPASAPTGVGNVARATSNSSLSKDDYWTRKEERDLNVQKRIEIQSCRNSAIALIDVLVKNEAFLKLPAQAKREAFLFELVNKYTADFVRLNDGTPAETLGVSQERGGDVEKAGTDELVEDTAEWN